jgi:hypothetical protein
MSAPSGAGYPAASQADDAEQFCVGTLPDLSALSGHERASVSLAKNIASITKDRPTIVLQYCYHTLGR